ncbi:UNVERIFIED_CONTAM: hypothetical protein FKN15_034639 [Acipenser sinensis]
MADNGSQFWSVLINGGFKARKLPMSANRGQGKDRGTAGQYDNRTGTAEVTSEKGTVSSENNNINNNNNNAYITLLQYNGGLVLTMTHPGQPGRDWGPFNCQAACDPQRDPTAAHPDGLRPLLGPTPPSIEAAACTAVPGELSPPLGSAPSSTEAAACTTILVQLHPLQGPVPSSTGVGTAE